MNKKYKTIIIETYLLLLSTYTGTKWLSKINVVVWNLFTDYNKVNFKE